MNLAMAQRRQSKNFFAFLTRPEFNPRDVIERDFDDDAYDRPLTAEPLDWHESRHWPALATD